MKYSFFFTLNAIMAGCGFLSAARADIACIQHVGYGITPVGAPGIRMVSAKVDIDWGDPGTLSAVFVMNNEEKKAADIQIGFPVPLPERYRKTDSFNFTMSFDGVPIDRASIQQVAPPKDQDTGVSVPASPNQARPAKLPWRSHHPSVGRSGSLVTAPGFQAGQRGHFTGRPADV